MKRALVISSMSLGGASRVMSLLANFWAARGDAVVLITLDSDENDAFALHDRVERVSLHLMRDSAGLTAALRNVSLRVRALRRAIVASGAPAVLSFEDRTNVLVVLAMMGLRVRTVVAERTDPTQHHIDTVWRILRWLTYRLADAVAIQTPALRAWAASVVRDESRVHVVPNPARDMTRFRAQEKARDGFTVVAVGRLVPEKAFDLLVRAFMEVADGFGDWRLVIAGEGPERPALEQLITELDGADRITLAGWVEEPGTVLARAHLFVMSSRYEGFPNALLEAMACGLPVISTAYAGSVDLIRDGVDGMLAEVGNADELAHALRTLMADAQLRKRLGANAEMVARRYALPSVIEIWDGLMWPPQRAEHAS